MKEDPKPVKSPEVKQEAKPSTPEVKNNKTVSPEKPVESFFNKNFYFFAGSILVCVLALYFLSQINFKILDLFKYPEIVDSLKQFTSTTFIQFVVLFSISVALALNSKLIQKNALILVPCGLALLVGFSLLFNLNWFLGATLGLIIGLCSFARNNESGLGSLYSDSSLPFIIGTIFLLLFVFLLFQSNKDAMVNDFFTSAQKAAPDLQGRVVNFCLAPVEQMLGSQSLFKSQVPFEDFKKDYLSQINASLPQGVNSSLVSAQVIGDQQIRDAYDSVANKSDTQVKQLVQQVKTQLSTVKLPNDQKTKDQIKNQVLQTDIGKIAFANLPIFLALALFPILSVLALVIRILAFIIGMPFFYSIK